MVDEYEEVYRNLIAERAQPARERVARRSGRPRLTPSLDQRGSGRRAVGQQSQTGA
jgi:hypothetical protein